jgi:hypothetical protein
MRQLVRSHWFSLADLVLACLCGLLVFVRPQWGGWLILIALIPWLARMLSGNKPFERSGFEVPLLIFIITAGIGIWAAYDKQAAEEKFWIIGVATIIFVALVGQPKANIGGVAGLVGMMGVIIAFYFILGNDWNLQSSDFGVINRVGRWIMTFRPAFEIPPLPPNFAGGLLAMIAPISLLYIYYSWRKRDLQMVIISGIMGFLILATLILTSSRGAFLALLTGAGIWFVWRTSLYFARKSKRSVSLIFLIIISMIAIPIVWFVVAYPGGLIALFDRLPGLASGESRLDLAISASKLIEDYPFTGGGLRSFPGLFSQYIMVTPYFLFAYSHNFYLDIILEQGFLGGLALLVLIFGSAIILARQILVDREDHQLKILGEAVFIGLIVILVHGLVDDALYGDLGTPLLLLLPGIAVMLVRSWQPADITAEQPENAINTVRDFESMQKGLFFGGVTFVIIMITFFIYQKQLLASWYANIGAVEMSRWELAGWPLDKWNADTDVSPIASAETMFSKSLSFNANQRTSRHRQGLIAMQRRDFGTASEELEWAYELDREHRGIRKSLGYAYVWDGKLDEAQMLLQEINEAEYEMGVYSWWWQELDRRDLAGQAREMEAILHAHNRFIQD